MEGPALLADTEESIGYSTDDTSEIEDTEACMHADFFNSYNYYLQEPNLSEIQKKRLRNIRELNEMKESLRFKEVQILQVSH